MPHWKLTLSYDGGRYHGWQVQPKLKTIQSALAEAIQSVTGESVFPQGSGRTDAGVHALAQVASFSLTAPVPPANLQRALNRVLGGDIRVTNAEIVPESFHARHSATGKVYEYRVYERRVRNAPGEAAEERICSPFLAPFAWDCRWPLELASMQEAAALVVGEHDFTSFAATDSEKHLRENDEKAVINPRKRIFSSVWRRENDLLIYQVHGSGFLHHMVRNLVGTFVDVGRGAILPADIPLILKKKDRAAAGPTAPARGLFLVRVDYEARS